MRLSLGRDDTVLLREAAAYLSRRMSDPRDVDTLGQVEDRLDALLLGRAPEAGGLELDPRQAAVLDMALASYAEVLSAPGSDVSNRARIARLQNVSRRIRSRSTVIGRLFGRRRG
jgi:hypothetical protein